MIPSFQQTDECSCWIRLKYSRRLSSAFFNEALFYELFPGCSIVSVILVKIVRRLMKGIRCRGLFTFNVKIKAQPAGYIPCVLVGVF